jgi:hypothetical protein
MNKRDRIALVIIISAMLFVVTAFAPVSNNIGYGKSLSDVFKGVTTEKDYYDWNEYGVHAETVPISSDLNVRYGDSVLSKNHEYRWSNNDSFASEAWVTEAALDGEIKINVSDVNFTDPFGDDEIENETKLNEIDNYYYSNVKDYIGNNSAEATLYAGDFRFITDTLSLDGDILTITYTNVSAGSFDSEKQNINGSEFDTMHLEISVMHDGPDIFMDSYVKGIQSSKSL